MFQKQFELRINISFSIDSKNFFLTCDHRKMLTLNFDSHFPQSITLSNFYPRLNVGIVLKSELSWLSEIVQYFNPRCLKSWEIPFFSKVYSRQIFTKDLKLGWFWNQNCPGFLKMPKFLILSASEAEKMYFARWPKYCETTCSCLSLIYGMICFSSLEKDFQFHQN